MDKQFLEWWGNFLLSVAKGKRQMDDMDRWFSQGLKGFPDLTAMLKQAYGIADDSRENGPDAISQWKKVNQQFLQSYGEFLDRMGVVPRSDHLRLVKKYEDLKQKSEEQAETIRHLRMLMDEKAPDKDQADRSDQTEVFEGFQEILQRQTEQFQELMTSMTRFYGDKAGKKASNEDMDS